MYLQFSNLTGIGIVLISSHSGTITSKKWTMSIKMKHNSPHQSNKSKSFGFPDTKFTSLVGNFVQTNIQWSIIFEQFGSFFTNQYWRKIWHVKKSLCAQEIADDPERSGRNGFTFSCRQADLSHTVKVRKAFSKKMQPNQPQPCSLRVFL